ncbi:MAG TPA: hypothetical protein PKA76_00615 [Pirellulaceae bacterium]|nr:hypothetical protein [Pirellulaceae bacterium]
MNEFEKLSTQGEMRRSAMRNRLQQQLLREAKQRKSLRRRSLAGLFVFAMVGVALLLVRLDTGNNRLNSELPNGVALIDREVGEEQDVIAVEPERLKLHLSHVSLTLIDDNEMLSLLDEAGFPSFIANTDRGMVVLPRKRPQNN